MHGVLGQTANKVKSDWPGNDLEFDGEGLAEDYKVASLLATDFKYNMFGKDEVAPLVLTKARMLLAGSRPTATYPSFASISTDRLAHQM